MLMIYVESDPCHPPMSGTRVGHEMLSENVIAVKVQHAKQSFRASRRELLMLDVTNNREPEPGDSLYTELMDYMHKTAGTRPLISP